MRNRWFWLFIIVLALIWAAAALLVQAQPAAGPSAKPQLQATLPPPLDVSLTAGPTRVCPGWNIYYSFVLTNTSQTDSFTNLVVTGGIPVGTWFNDEEPNAISGTIDGEFDEDEGVIRWEAASVAPRSVVKANLVLHTFTYLTPGTIITNTFTYSATELPLEESIQAGVTVDASQCPTPTRTPTRTATPTNTPPIDTPTATPSPTETSIVEPSATPTTFRGFYLPLVYK